MDYLILGLLILSPMTGYELQKFIKNNLSLICSHSAGSVQTALSKLEKEEKVMYRESVEGKRRKKIYTITEAGRTAFSKWLSQPMQANKVKNMELSRLFFAGLAKPDERVASIKNYIEQIEKTRSILCMIREYFQQIDQQELPAGTDWQQVLRFQGYTLDYGIAAAEFEISWYRHLLVELEERL